MRLMTNIKVYSDQPCSRCGSKKNIANRHEEVITTYMGTSVLKYSDIICTNKECQEKFEKTRVEDAQKYMDHKLAKEKAAIESAVRLAESRAKKNKSKLQ